MQMKTFRSVHSAINRCDEKENTLYISSIAVGTINIYPNYGLFTATGLLCIEFRGCCLKFTYFNQTTQPPRMPILPTFAMPATAAERSSQPRDRRVLETRREKDDRDDIRDNTPPESTANGKRERAKGGAGRAAHLSISRPAGPCPRNFDHRAATPARPWDPRTGRGTDAPELVRPLFSSPRPAPTSVRVG